MLAMLASSRFIANQPPSCQEGSEINGDREKDKIRDVLLSRLFAAPLHPLTLSDRLHLIPSSVVYHLVPPGTVLTLACKCLVENQNCKFALLNSPTPVFAPQIT